MKFGKTIESSAKELPEEWQPYLIQYKLLKKNIKTIVQELDSTLRTLNISPSACLDEAADTNPENSEAGLLGGMDYTIEKDSDGLVHPVITVKIRRPVLAPERGRIIKLSPAAGLPEDASIRIQPAPSDKDGEPGPVSDKDYKSGLVPDKDGEPDPGPETISLAITSNDASTTRTVEDMEETQVMVRLEADQRFFDQLMVYIGRMQQFGQRYTAAYHSNVSHLGAELAGVTSPFKHDFEIWREIFRLYIDAEVWSHPDGDLRATSTAKEGQERFEQFARHIEATGLAQRFRDPISARLLMSFFGLNLELARLKLLQEMNGEAARKIIKKHDKRMHLVAKTQFPQLMTIDTASLTQALICAIHADLVGVVPQLDDYLCPMCLGIVWRPLRLECNHVFCSRCIVKASRRRMFNCPICRAKGAVYRAGVTNVDKALLNFLKLYFPREIQEKQRDVQRDISDEETKAMVAAQTRHNCIVM